MFPKANTNFNLFMRKSIQNLKTCTFIGNKFQNHSLNIQKFDQETGMAAQEQKEKYVHC